MILRKISPTETFLYSSEKRDFDVQKLIDKESFQRIIKHKHPMFKSPFSLLRQCDWIFMDKEQNNDTITRNTAQATDSGSVVDSVIATLSKNIAEGIYRPGQRIPTEPELAQKLGAGRNSVREGIKILVAMGVLEIKRADGTFVVNGYSPKMLDPILYGMLLESGNTYALADLRRLLETGVFRQAVERSSDADAARLADRLEQIEHAVASADADAMVAADLAFHGEIRRIAGNVMTDRICAMVEHMTLATRRRIVEASLRADGGTGMLARHRAMYKVVAQRDTATASFVGDELFNALETL